ncbi:hypothetical protein [Jannaschia donghaensis]|uniref:ATP-dependent Clp protease proteolytic subunit n=1 Tax=Jannaschia donghaensis TaxID=420998 RepID=A0A0M6YKP3_9RHOB|nr:hypothetical protein [Jannaschia donghaensis]CTQ50938.1 hypothetical protein JDO7802_02969 [Jannaschia donghaensis]
MKALVILCVLLATPALSAPTAAKVARLTCLMIARDLGIAAPNFTAAEPTKPTPATAAAWAQARSDVDAMPYSEARTIWNRACAGATGRTNWPILPDPMRPTLLRVDGTALRVTGIIRPGFVRRLRRTLDANPQITRIALTSPGGLLDEAFSAADLIRRRGLDTTLIGGCFSACGFVFLGGASRDIPVTHWPLGFHQAAWRDGQAISMIHPVQVRMMLSLSSLGVETQTIMGWITAAGPGEMFIPDTAQICAAGIAPLPGCGAKDRRAR